MKSQDTRDRGLSFQVQKLFFPWHGVTMPLTSCQFMALPSLSIVKENLGRTGGMDSQGHAWE